MALQSSGAIKFSELRTEYGGNSANPISLSEYYRSNASGMLVVDSVFSFTSGGYNTGPTAMSTSTHRHTAYSAVYTDSTIINSNSFIPTAPSTNSIYYVPNSTTSPSAGDIKYVRNASYYASGYVAGDKYTSGYNWYQYGMSKYVYVAASSTTVYYNANVPTSSTISMSNFHAGDNP